MATGRVKNSTASFTLSKGVVVSCVANRSQTSAICCPDASSTHSCQSTRPLYVAEMSRGPT